MKKIVLFIVAILFFQVTFAQNNQIKSEMELMQDAFGFEKKDVMSEFVDLTGVNANNFWKLYNEYEIARKKMGKEKMDLLYRYTTHKGSVSNVQAENLMKRVIPLRKNFDKLVEKYYKKIKKATNPLVAAQFYQIEHYIADGINFTILDMVDFIQDK
jgi:hypothetical protein